MEIKWIGIKLNGKIVAVLGGVGGKENDLNDLIYIWRGFDLCVIFSSL